MKDEEFSLHERHWLHDAPSVSALAAFEAIVRLGSFAQAARELNRTPSAISHTIRELEKRTGVALLERNGRRVKLTTVGSIYFRDVEAALDALKRGARTLRQHGDDPVIRVSAPPLIVATVLIPHMAAFESAFPPYRLKIETTNQIVSLRDGEVDLGIRFARSEEMHLHRESLPPVCGVPVCSPQFAAKHGIKSIEHLAEVPRIQVTQAPDSWSMFFAENGVVPESEVSAIEFDSTISALEAARQGLGVAIGIFPLVAAYPGYGSELIRIGWQTLAYSETYGVECRDALAQEQRVQVFVGWLRNTLVEMQRRYTS